MLLKSLFCLLCTCAILTVFPEMIRGQNLPPYSAVLHDQAGTTLSPENMVSLPGGDYLVAGNRYNEGFLMRIDSLANPLWVRSYSLGQPFISPNIRFRFLNMTLDGNAIVAGSCLDTSDQSLKGFLMKVNLSGDTLWCRKVEMPGLGGELLFVSPTSDSGFICCGYLDELGTGGQVVQRYIHAMKTDADGHTLWSTAIDAGNNNDYGRVIKEVSTGGYMLVGYREDFAPYDGGAIYIRLSDTGAIIYAGELKSPSPQFPFCAGNDFVELNHHFYLYVNTDTGPGVVRLDTNGGLLSQFMLVGQGQGGQLLYPGSRIKQLSDGHLLMVNDNFSGGLTVKTDTLGNMVWAHNHIMRTYDVTENNDGSLTFLGGGPLFGVSTQQPFRHGTDTETGIIHTDSMGIEPQCTGACFFTIQPSSLTSASVNYTTNPGGVTIPVTINDQPQMALRFTGCVSVLGGISESDEKASIRVYPNPGSGFFQISATGKMDVLSVFDAAGRPVIRLAPGATSAEFSMHDHPTGMYYLKTIIDGVPCFSQLFLLPAGK